MGQRNLYILPTGAGWLLGATLLALLVGSINYQLNLGYLLTFLVAGCALVSVPMSHRTLLGLELHLRAPRPTFAGQAAPLSIGLHNPDTRWRRGLGLMLLDAELVPVASSEEAVWTDCPPAAQHTVELAWTAPSRGWHSVPPIRIETRFPLGIFRVWSLWRPAAEVLCYPAPEAHAPASPAGAPGPRDDASHAMRSAPSSDDLPDEVRPYRRGDTLRQIVWKKAARTGELVSRHRSAPPPAGTQWLRWSDAAPERGTEPTLERLCAWVLAADAAGLPYGLMLPSRHGDSTWVAPAIGAAHRMRCLQALAEFGLPPHAGTTTAEAPSTSSAYGRPVSSESRHD